ncbi:hypothetical protein [Streptomyces niphimycinicus]|uniref:hypothetical protein n=1 Tax=Streptomyces niphimycinicus TaxID=2842201 RepID=UPI00209A6FC4|nr:hypothetical protein [Streptomyces niphimycinicus]
MSVDEHELFGRARELPEVGAPFAVGGPALCWLSPFGSGLGKAVAEEAAGHTAAWLPALYVLVSAVTGGAVLRAGLRIFAGVGRRPRDGHPASGPETGAGALFTDTGGYRRSVLVGRAAAVPASVPPHWQATGILLGPFSTALAITLAALAVRRPVHTGTAALLAPVRRLQSGHIGDYVAWLVAGTALLTVPTVPGVR